MKLMHAADIHLDRPLSGLSAYPGALAAKLRERPAKPPSWLTDRAIEKSVDFMVIADGLYDGTWRDYNTGIFFCKEMSLKQAGIPVKLLFGNHNAESEMTRKLALPGNVFCFSASKPETFRIEGLSVALHGHSFKQKECALAQTAHFSQPSRGLKTPDPTST